MNQAKKRESGNGHANLNVSRLPFAEIPHQSKLFLEYLRDPLSLKKFYPNAVASAKEAGSFAAQVLDSYQTDREVLCDALRETNSEAGAKTLANVEALRRGDTVAVLTGQQAGLFTGPLYTIYKALSAIKLAEELNASGIRAVAVFWAATEDHDFEEVSSANFIGQGGDELAVSYHPADYSNSLPVGSVNVDGGIVDVIDKLFLEMPPTEFSASMREILAAAWSPSVGFGTAFMSTMMSLLEQFGLIFVDPMHEDIKRLAAPIYIEAIRNANAIVNSLPTRSAELAEAGFHSQVLIEDDHFPLFWIDDAGRRKALRKSGDGIYRVKGEKAQLTATDLEQFAIDNPRRLSPGVMLRPVVQDYLFPTIGYFGGGAEIAYFAQNSEVYRVLGRPVTPIFHRQSLTIVEPAQARSLEKFNLALPDLFLGEESLRLSLAETLLAPDTGRLFSDIEEKIGDELSRLQVEITAIDPTLTANLAKRREKIVYHLASIKKKALLAHSRNDEAFERRLSGLFATLLPSGQLQERSLNVFSFLNKYGPKFIDWIYDAIDLNDKEHRIIDL